MKTPLFTRRIVLTGGPCAGKTTIAEVIVKAFARKIVLVPESASLLMKGGFTRWDEINSRKAFQEAVFHTQRGLELAYATHFSSLSLLMDRGTVDGAAYWPEKPENFFSAMNTTLERELTHYDQVIFLESAGKKAYELNRTKNPMRGETWSEAVLLDQTTLKLWAHHPHFTLVRNQRDFEEKISAVLKIVERSLDDKVH